MIDGFLATFFIFLCVFIFVGFLYAIVYLYSKIELKILESKQANKYCPIRQLKIESIKDGMGFN